MSVKIYVPLEDGGVDVWRPVRARPLAGDVYQIVDQAYDRQVEKWRFEPGEHVVCAWVDADGRSILRAERLFAEDPGRPIPPPRFAQLLRRGPSTWTGRDVRLIFLVGGVVLGTAAVVECLLQVAGGEWGLAATIGLFIAGVGFVGLNVVFPASRATAERISGAAWPIGGAFVVLMAVLQTSDTSIDSVVTPFAGGLGLAFAAVLIVDRAKGNRVLDWDEAGRS